MSCFFGLADQQGYLTLYSVARLQRPEHIARTAAQKFFVQLGHFAGDYHVPGVSQNLDYVCERFDDAVRGFIENLRTRRGLDCFQRRPPLAALRRKKSAEAKRIRWQ